MYISRVLFQVTRCMKRARIFIQENVSIFANKPCETKGVPVKNKGVLIKPGFENWASVGQLSLKKTFWRISIKVNFCDCNGGRRAKIVDSHAHVYVSPQNRHTFNLFPRTFQGFLLKNASVRTARRTNLCLNFHWIVLTNCWMAKYSITPVSVV